MLEYEESGPGVISSSTKKKRKRSLQTDDLPRKISTVTKVSELLLQKKMKQRPSAVSDSSLDDSDEAPDDSDRDPDYILPSDDGDDESSESHYDEVEIPWTQGRQVCANDVVRETVERQSSEQVIQTKQVSSSVDCLPTDESLSKLEGDFGKADDGHPASVVTVARSQRNGIFNKRPYCYYCGVQQSQVQRHWFSKHGSEKYVIEIAMCKDIVKRRQLIGRLRNLGNHCHNVDVLSKGCGELMVTHRKNSTSNCEAEDYLACDRCYSYVMKNELWRHKCVFGKAQKGRVAHEAQMMLPAPNGMSTSVYELINSMKADEIRFLAKSDPLIMDYAAKLVQSKGMKKQCYIRDKVREVARFLMQIRKYAGMEKACMKDCISPERFKICLLAVRELAGFDVQTASYRTPSLALKIGHALKKLAKLMKRQAIESRTYDIIVDIDYYHDLCVSEWGDEIARNALDTLRHQRRNKVNLLPVTRDVQKLLSHIRQASARCCEELRNAMRDGATENVPQLFRELAEVTLVDVITFNRRRQGEVAQLTVDDYNRKTTADVNSDVHSGLSDLEQNLCKLFSRIELRGKRDGIVPVLLTEHVRSAIDLLNECRSYAGVKPSNQYVFAMSYSDNYIRGSDALRKAASQCGAENPSTLTSTNFRRHIATLSQLIDLKDNELDALAQFMGHDIRVHRKFYRLPNDVVQMSQLAKIFLLMEKGEIAVHKGKTLDELMAAVMEDTGEISE